MVSLHMHHRFYDCRQYQLRSYTVTDQNKPDLLGSSLQNKTICLTDQNNCTIHLLSYYTVLSIYCPILYCILHKLCLL